MFSFAIWAVINVSTKPDSSAESMRLERREPIVRADRLGGGDWAQATLATDRNRRAEQSFIGRGERYDVDRVMAQDGSSSRAGQTECDNMARCGDKVAGILLALPARHSLRPVRHGHLAG